MAGQRDKTSHIRASGRLAWRTDRAALLPAQNTEEGVPNSVLDNYNGMAGRVVGCVDGDNHGALTSLHVTLMRNDSVA